ncbi:MAG: cell surface protein SprA, partial [Cyclobacteriaceae bacterium]|nr:cell surface protein SprA [Cyclobacteriaceae bacterium]
MGTGSVLASDLVTFQTDTVKKDSIPQIYVPSILPTFQPKDRFGDPFSNTLSKSPLLLTNPNSLTLDVDIDTGMNYTIYEKIGDLNYRPASSMTFEEFKRYQEREILKNYWKNRSTGLDGESAVSGRNIIPPIYISPVLDRIFGGSTVEIIPTGFVTLDFGGRWQRIENSQIPIRQQRNGGFEFDQQISMNVIGKIGEKMAVTANFDNNNSFDFQNNLKMEYTGFKEDILKKLELGNVSLPLNNSLINGAQNLFGIKTQMQFGRLFVTSVASTQRGKTEIIEIEGGDGQGRLFDISGSDYDENRHFFLGHFFKNNYQSWVGTLPQITSGVNITRVEIYVVNRNNDTETQRNIVGLMDMAEAYNVYAPNIGNPNVISSLGNPKTPNYNGANDLFAAIQALTSAGRNVDNINTSLEAMGFINGTDFEKINSARKLSPNEYTINHELGYISLYRRLQNDEAIAVAFEYTYNGRNYKVGELSEDYSARPEDEAIFLKLLRPRKINIRDAFGNRIPSWDLMMKNVYALSSTNIEREGFQLRIIYRDDRTGIDNPQLQEGVVARTKQLIDIFGLDRLNQNNDPQRDGNFDFVDGITVDTQNGLIIFPYLQPFNTPLRNVFSGDPKEEYLIEKYVYDTLYNTTKADAELEANKNKFFIIGRMQSGSATEIQIPGFNIAKGSVKVYAGGSSLREGVDYQVDYTFGKVNIINSGVLNSGKKITISYEKDDIFNFQTRTLLGSRFDYSLGKDVNLGATLLYMNERPLISRISIGSEPARNTKYGFDVNLRKDSRFITKAVDFIPLIQTKEVSNVNFSAEFAQLLPGTSNIVDGEGTSYIDDFENAATPISMQNHINWKLGSIPQTNDYRFDPSSGARNDITAGYKRAKLAWYQVDNIFYRNGGPSKPENITSDDLKNHYVRPVNPQEIFRNRDLNVINTNEPIFDLAFYPSERGPYNFNTDLNINGTLKNPTENWGAITSAIRSEVDFDKSNIEYVEFWLLDPFITTENGKIDDGVNPPQNNTTGGELFLNLGSISEDIIRDGKHGFENGLPIDGSITDVDSSSPWGSVTTKQFITNAFANESGARENQDVGLDGLDNEKESEKFAAFLSAIPAQARDKIISDPAADDFQYFLGNTMDKNQAEILERYKNFNGTENNSPIFNTNLDYTASGTNLPDNEDLNLDNTMSELEEYYEYRIPLRPNTMNVNNKFIVDEVSYQHESSGDEVTWYLFRIPIRNFDDKFGNINGFKNIRYMRMITTNFSQPVVLRMANFRLVGSKWRRYKDNLEEPRFGQPLEPDLDNFTVSVIGVEENGEGSNNKSPYVLPPDFKRDRDNTAAIERQLNEQSLQICINNLEDTDARAVFKNVNLDMINYGRIKMFIHADSDVNDDELTAFVRLGTDFNQNYYEIEVPLKITSPGSTLATDIWPAENEIDLDLNELLALKSSRNNIGAPITQLFPVSGPRIVNKHRLRVLGRPKLSDVRTIMIGVRNPASADKLPISVCVWVNELRVTDFDTTPGWAANASLNLKLADFANVSASARHTTYGFGGIQSRIAERTREETTNYDISANISLDKFFPEKAGIQLPMFVSYEKTHIKPRFDPLDPDITLEASLLNFDTQKEKSEYRALVEDLSERKSLNFSNVRKMRMNQERTPRFYDISNLSFTYAFSEMNQSDYKTESYLRRSYRGSVAYTFSPKSVPWEPFKEAAAFKSPYLQLIRDFNINFKPSNISIRGDLDRRFTRTYFRDDLLNQGSSANYEKYFTLNRNYDLRWDITRALNITYRARANAIIDEPEGDIDNEMKRDSIIVNIRNLGRMKNFDQSMDVTYRLPLDKIPLTNWISADYKYGTSYSWKSGPVNQPDSLRFGNIIQNSRDNSLNGKIDLVKFYNKIEYLKEINTPPRPVRAGAQVQQQQQDSSFNKKPELKTVKNLLRLMMSLKSINGTYSLREGTALPGFIPSPTYFGLDSTFTTPGLPFIFGRQDSDFRFKAQQNNWLVTSNSLTTPYLQVRSEDISLKANVEPFRDFR